MEKALRGALKLLRLCSHARRGDRILIVTDLDSDPAIARTIMAAATSLKLEAMTITMKTRALPGDEPPEPVAAAMMNSDVVICPTYRTMYHTDARLEACKKGAKFISMAGATMSVLSSDAMYTDFAKQEHVLRRVVAQITRAKNIRLSNPAGTRLEFSVRGRTAHGVPGYCKRPGDATGTPDIEAYVAPVEKSVNGILMIDGSTSVTGVVDKPIEIEILHGIAVGIRGGNQALRLQKILDKTRNPAAFQVAEFGIGLNPKARIRGAIIEDEGALGTAHIALGDNTRLGGKNSAPLHVDLVFRRALVELDGHTLLKQGRLYL